MPSGYSHTRARRILDTFKRLSDEAVELGVGRRLIEDERFNRDTIVLDGESVANFGLCSYLGLGDDERVVAAAIEATRRFGVSYSSSIAYTSLGMYADLKDRLSAMMGAPVVVAGTTTLAHLAALPVLIGRGDMAVIDGQAHASLLAVTPTLISNGAQVEMIAHNDIDALEDRIAEAGPDRPVWYVTDGVFSMHGDTIPAEEVHDLLNTHPNLHVYCDDAHGFGWKGERGCGVYLDRVGWHQRLVVAVGLAKSFGTMGGLVATPNQDLVDLINLTGAPLVFGGPLPPPVLGASIAAADIHLSDDLGPLQSELIERIRLVNTVARRHGIPFSGFDETPLWFLEVGRAETMLRVLSTMKASGFFLNGAVFPVVPRGHAGVRFTITNYNSKDQIESMLSRLNEVRLELVGDTTVEIDLTSAEATSVPQTEELG